MDVPGLRPTTDRIRETLFNWLGQDLSGLNCIDLFAGTGALGFEAASRGAGLVVLFEKDKRAYANLVNNFQQLQSSPVHGAVEILHGNSLDYLKQQANCSSNLIFIEWPEKVSGILPTDLIKLNFKFINENEREIEK
mgnify:CR=1 FL=1